MEKRVIRAAVSVVVLVTFLGVTVACYGPFNLTRTLYKWNSNVKGTGDVNTKWMRELVFLGLVILPAYGFSLLLDALIFNSIEFWGGENPIKMSRHGEDGQIQTIQAGETTVTLAVAKDGNSAHVTYAKAGQVFKTAEIVQSGDSYQFVDENGRALYLAEMSSDGGLNIVDDECRLIDTVSGERLWQAANNLAALQVASN
ncbi:MAG: DUF3332 family protein [Nitrososphaera sp.]